MMKNFIKEGKLSFDEAIKLLGINNNELNFEKEEIEEINKKAKEYKKQEELKDQNKESEFKKDLKVEIVKNAKVKKENKNVEVDNKEYNHIVMKMIIENISMEEAARKNDITEKELFQYIKTLQNSKNSRNKTIFNFTRIHIKHYKNFRYFDSEQKEFIDDYLKSRIRVDKEKEEKAREER